MQRPELVASVLSTEGSLLCFQIFVKNLEAGGRKTKPWLKGRWKNLEMEVGEGSTDRHRPFILTSGGMKCLIVPVSRGLRGAWRLGGRRESLLHPHAPWEQVPTHCAAV